MSHSFPALRCLAVLISVVVLNTLRHYRSKVGLENILKDLGLFMRLKAQSKESIQFNKCTMSTLHWDTLDYLRTFSLFICLRVVNLQYTTLFSFFLLSQISETPSTPIPGNLFHLQSGRTPKPWPSLSSAIFVDGLCCSVEQIFQPPHPTQEAPWKANVDHCFFQWSSGRARTSANGRRSRWVSRMIEWRSFQQVPDSSDVVDRRDGFFRWRWGDGMVEERESRKRGLSTVSPTKKIQCGFSKWFVEVETVILQSSVAMVAVLTDLRYPESSRDNWQQLCIELERATSCYGALRVWVLATLNQVFAWQHPCSSSESMTRISG